MYETVANVVNGRRRARHLGRERPRGLRARHRRLARHGARRDLGRRRLEQPGLRAGADGERPRRARRGRRASRSCRRRRAGAARVADDRPHARRRRHAHRHAGQAGRPQPVRHRRRSRTASRRRSPAGSLAGAIALVSRGDCTFVSKAGRARQAGAIGIISSTTGSGEANGVPIQLRDPGRDDLRRSTARRCAAAMASARRPDARSASAATFEDIATGRSGDRHELLVGGPDRVRARAQAGRLRARRRDPLVDAAELAGGAVRRLRRHEHGGAARRRARPRCSLQRHPSWSPQQIKSALMSTAGPAWGDTARTQEALGAARGQRA